MFKNLMNLMNLNNQLIISIQNPLKSIDSAGKKGGGFIYLGILLALSILFTFGSQLPAILQWFCIYNNNNNTKCKKNNNFKFVPIFSHFMFFILGTYLCLILLMIFVDYALQIYKYI